MREKGQGDSVAARYGMWFFLFTEMLFFGGMFLLYSVFRSRYPLSFHAAAMEESLAMGSINTAILLTGSLTIALSLTALEKGSLRLSSLLQAATILLGTAFLIVKFFEWSAKIHNGIYPGSSLLLQKDKGEVLFFSLYFVMTGIHGLHVLAGIIAIGVLLYSTLRGSAGPDNLSLPENTGLYWHFVDIVWIYLFPLFYLIP